VFPRQGVWACGAEPVRGESEALVSTRRRNASAWRLSNPFGFAEDALKTVTTTLDTGDYAMMPRRPDATNQPSADRPAPTGRCAPLVAALFAAVLGAAGVAASGCPQDQAEAAPVPPAALRIGVGGDYPNGIDGQLSALGLPYRRVFQWELNQPDVLREYDVLFLSCVPEAQNGIDVALLEWLKAGGRAYVETWAAQNRYPLRQVVKTRAGAPTLGDVVIVTPDHPIAAGLDASVPINMHHLQGVCVTPTESASGQTIALYCPDEGREPVANAGAIVCLSVGQGELVYSAAPLAFARFHRGRSPEALLVGIIDYLTPERTRHRLWFAEPEADTSEAGETPGSASAPSPPVTGSASCPDGFELLDGPVDGPYCVLADIVPANGDQVEPSVLLLDGAFSEDGTALQPGLWLEIGRERVQVRRGKTPSGHPIAAASWQPQEGSTRLLARRLTDQLSVILGDAELLRCRAKGPPRGVVALRNGGVAISEPLCQPVEPPVFSDDFMREPDEPTPWSQVSGQWKNVGVGNEEYSINGFYFLGRGDGTALATAGDWFWEDYTFTCAVRLDDASATCGLCALVQENGDSVAFVADSAEASSPRLRVVRGQAGQESDLAELGGGLAPNQWYRLGLRVTESAVEAFLDGDVVLSCSNPEVRSGAIGLLVRGGSARFDDVLVQSAEQPLRVPRDEGSPEAHLPPSLGPHDYMTWASPAEPWVACAERPALLWHEGVFAGDLEVSLPVRPTAEPASRRIIFSPEVSDPESCWLSVAAQTSPGTGKAQLTVCRPPGKPAARLVALREAAQLAVVRSGRSVRVLWSGKPVFRLGNAGEYRRVGLEVEGPPVTAQDLHVRSPSVRDYMFGIAPTDWWVSGGEWGVSARWACDNRWSWLGGWGSGDVAIWNKRRLQGDVMVEYYVGIKMQAPGGPETQRCRDLNTVLCGDRSDPRSGYNFILGGDGGVKTQLLKHGQVVAENPDVRVPAGYNVHHRWFRIRAARIGSRLELDFEGRPVFRYEDAEPLEGGYVGLWTRNSGILVPRVTVYHSDSQAAG